MGGQVLELKYYDGLVKREEQTKQKIFFNIMTGCLKNEEDKVDGVHNGIQMCKFALPDWNKNKIQSELTAIQKDLNIDLNISDIFLNIEVMEKISDKNFSEAYKLYCKNETVKDEDKPLEFMKKVVKTLGTDGDIINKAIEVVADIEDENNDPSFRIDLLQSTLKTREYQETFEKEQSKIRKNIR